MAVQSWAACSVETTRLWMSSACSLNALGFFVESKYYISLSNKFPVLLPCGLHPVLALVIQPAVAAQWDYTVRCLRAQSLRAQLLAQYLFIFFKH